MVGPPEDIGRRLAPLVRTRYQPSTIGVCLRTPGSLPRLLAATEVVFATLARELAS